MTPPPLCTDEPSVLTWAIALAPRPRHEPLGRHWWRELVVDAWQAATASWERQAEAASNGWATELAEFEATHPRPRLADFMSHLSQGKWAPESLELLAS